MDSDRDVEEVRYHGTHVSFIGDYVKCHICGEAEKVLEPLITIKQCLSRCLPFFMRHADCINTIDGHVWGAWSVVDKLLKEEPEKDGYDGPISSIFLMAFEHDIEANGMDTATLHLTIWRENWKLRHTGGGRGR